MLQKYVQWFKKGQYLSGGQRMGLKEQGSNDYYVTQRQEMALHGAVIFPNHLGRNWTDQTNKGNERQPIRGRAG